MSKLGFFDPPDVEKLKSAHDTDGLIKALKCKKNKSLLWFRNLWNPIVWRGETPITLMTNFKGFLQILRIAGSTEDLAIRAEAAAALAEIGGERATEALSAALHDDYNDERVLSAITKAIDRIQKAGG